MPAIRELRRSSGAMRCLECGKCSTLCPLSSLRNFSAARMAAIHDSATDLVDLAETVGRCLTCASCEVRCPQGVRFTDFVRGLRQKLPPALHTPAPHLGMLQASAKLDRPRELWWLDDDLKVAERGEVALFVGCAPAFDILFEKDLGVRTLDVTRAAIRLLNAAGIEPVVLTGERCCGHDFLWSGQPDAFTEMAKANTAAFESHGVKHIVTTCAECTRTWKIDYAEAVPRYRPRVEHIVEWLAGSSLAFESHEKVTFHDPCRLARHIGVTDAPRRLLESTGANLVEMARHGADGQCCGTPGFIHCNGESRALQQKRLDDALATGAERMLTACPKCRIHFACAQSEDSLRQRSRPRIEIEDITTFAERAVAMRRAGAPPATATTREKGNAS